MAIDGAENKWVGTYSGGLLVYRGGGVVSLKNESIIIPKGYSISQNFPNPFNPVTTIDFSVPKYSMVTIKVFDILGREITTLINENKSPGNYSVDFNATNLSSGIYVYTMECDEFFYSRKMAILK